MAISQTFAVFNCSLFIKTVWSHRDFSCFQPFCDLASSPGYFQPFCDYAYRVEGVGAGVSCHNKKKGHMGGVTSGRYHLGTVALVSR